MCWEYLLKDEQCCTVSNYATWLLQDCYVSLGWLAMMHEYCPVLGSAASSLHSPQLVWMRCLATQVAHHFMLANMAMAPLRRIQRKHRAVVMLCRLNALLLFSAVHSGSLLVSTRSLDSSI